MKAATMTAAIASSTDNWPCQRIAGVGQTLPNVSVEFRKISARTSETQLFSARSENSAVAFRLSHNHSTSTANEYVSAASPIAATIALAGAATNGATAIVSAATWTTQTSLRRKLGKSGRPSHGNGQLAATNT